VSVDPLERGSAADIAAAARAVWRAEEAEWTQAAFERWHHERTVFDVLRDVMHRGDMVSVELHHATYRGTVCAVGEDFFSLAASDARVDIRVAAGCALLLRVVERALAGGTRGDDVGTFRARLLALEASTDASELGTTVRTIACDGRIRVGRDHVVARDLGGNDAVVPLDAIVWVRVIAD